MDWDNDGRKDLILGERDGWVKLYKNTNTDADPVFNGFEYIKRAGSNYDVGYTSSPYICDWNNDAKKDLLVGEDNGYVYLLINTGTDAAPSFSTAVQIQSGSSALDVGSRASPVVYDWNGDGKKDLLVGETYGNIYYFENTGTDAAPAFNGSTTLKIAGGATLDVGYYPRFEVCDWNNDSVQDIVCGYYDTSSSPSGGVRIFEGGYDLYADLAVVSLSGPVQALPGQVIGPDVDLTIINQGTVGCTSFQVQFFLSVDPEITSSDQALNAGSVYVSSLGAGSTYDVTPPASMAIPAGTGFGTYYLGPLIDRYNAIPESDESNNDASYEIYIGAIDPIPDIDIDGKDGPMVVSKTTKVNMTISLLAGEMQGASQDWWIVAKKGGNYFSWLLPPPHWTAGVKRAYVGPLFDLNPYQLHYGTIPAGTWVFTFAVDNPNNVYEGTYKDEIQVTSY